jgi:hypothetical protein
VLGRSPPRLLQRKREWEEERGVSSCEESVWPDSSPQADEVKGNACSRSPGAALEQNQRMDASFGLPLVGQDNSKTSQHVHEATAEEVTSSLEAHETVGSSLITLQVAYLRLTQRLLLNWMELLTPVWWQPTHKQPEAFQRLLTTPMQPYLDWRLAPLTLSR